MIFKAFCGHAFWRALYVHCAKHDVCAPLYFHQQNAAILLLEACRQNLHWCTMQDTQLWSPIFGLHAEQMLQCCFFVCGWQLLKWKCVWIGVLARAKREFVQACVCTSINEKKNCCVFVWWVAALKLRVCLDWGFGKCKRELVQTCSCTSISQKIFPGFLRKNQPSSYMLSHHTWSPRAPLINVVAQCMPASEPKWLFFF